MNDAELTALRGALETLSEMIAKQTVEQMLKRMPQSLVEAEADPLLSAARGAKLIGLSETTVRQLMKAGRIECAPGLNELRARKSAFQAYGK